MRPILAKKRWWLTGGLICLLLIGAVYRHQIASGLMAGFHWVTDRESVQHFIAGFGNGAPLVFMAIQVIQVVLAPIPGEATGFIGGYLFGTINGFVYSSVALAIGSWANFAIGRYLGKRFVRRWIPAEKWERFDHLLKHQGIIVLFILFIFPGFPKDYLCLFLGITAIPIKAFLLIAAVGRMPGTLLLSLQGDYLFQKNYAVLAAAFALTALVALMGIRYRNQIYRWIETLNGKTEDDR